MKNKKITPKKPKKLVKKKIKKQPKKGVKKIVKKEAKKKIIALTKKTVEQFKTIKKQDSYGAKQITVLEGLDPVRRRPAMYIGSTGFSGLHHLLHEVVDNSIDEAIAGYCHEITVELLPDNKVRVSDDGRGIPVDMHKPTGKSALEVVITKLHDVGKFVEGA
ncbi:hypothetical protein IID20_04570, partial [Patescibacteria group bacterium]|nr:hypothetical protein [Patescibacteria group bacterium]